MEKGYNDVVLSSLCGEGIFYTSPSHRKGFFSAKTSTTTTTFMSHCLGHRSIAFSINCRLVEIVVFVISRVIMTFNLQVLYFAIAYRGVDSFTFFGQRSSVPQYSTSIGSTCHFKIDEVQRNRNNFQLQMSADQTDFVKADDGEALQELFSSYCDKDGLMTKNTLKTEISVIKELLVRRFMYFLSFNITIFHIRISSYDFF